MLSPLIIIRRSLPDRFSCVRNGCAVWNEQLLPPPSSCWLNFKSSTILCPLSRKAVPLCLHVSFTREHCLCPFVGAGQLLCCVLDERSGNSCFATEVVAKDGCWFCLSTVGLGFLLGFCCAFFLFQRELKSSKLFCLKGGKKKITF